MRTKKINKRLTKLHAIQLVSLGVAELFIKANQPPDISVEYEDRSFTLSVGHNEYDSEEKTIDVTLKVEIGMGDNDTKSDHPFSLKVKVIGHFSVNTDQFPSDQIYDWARRNAPFILYPYVREHAFALTARCGFRPILLPLLEVPTLKVRNRNTKEEVEESNPK